MSDDACAEEADGYPGDVDEGYIPDDPTEEAGDDNLDAEHPAISDEDEEAYEMPAERAVKLMFIVAPSGEGESLPEVELQRARALGDGLAKMLPASSVPTVILTAANRCCRGVAMLTLSRVHVGATAIMTDPRFTEAVHEINEPRDMDHVTRVCQRSTAALLELLNHRPELSTIGLCAGMALAKGLVAHLGPMKPRIWLNLQAGDIVTCRLEICMEGNDARIKDVEVLSAEMLLNPE